MPRIKEQRAVRGVPARISTFALIRDFITDRGASSPYDFWSTFSDIHFYNRVVYYFWVLETLGMIRVVQDVPSSRGGFPKRLYDFAPGVEMEDPRWYQPQQYLYPDTTWGGRRYSEAAGRGMTRRGRNERYVLPGELPEEAPPPLEEAPEEVPEEAPEEIEGTPEQQAVLRAMPATTNEIVRATGLKPEEVNAILTVLEIDGRVGRGPGGRWRRQ